MFQKNDLILLLVIFGSMGLGIGFPEFGRIFLPYPLYFMMLLLFLSFLEIQFIAILKDMKKTILILFLLCFFKLIILPAGLFFLTQMIWPDYALPVLLLSGISTGVVAPFISNLLRASTSLVLMMVVISSLLVPFSLPGLVSLLAGQYIEISFSFMVKTLAMVVFLPAFAVLVARQLIPSFLEKLERVQFPLSLVLFASINLGVFSKYSSFFMENFKELTRTTLLAFLLSAIYHIVGFGVTWGMKRGGRLAGAISFANINNVLIIVFSSQFFGPLSPTLAAMYMLPFFTMIIPARIAARFLKETTAVDRRVLTGLDPKEFSGLLSLDK